MTNFTIHVIITTEAKESTEKRLKMEITRFRVIYKDGSVSAWTTDLKMAKETARFFGGKLESWTVTLP